jgi:hypothetical protein
MTSEHIASTVIGDVGRSDGELVTAGLPYDLAYSELATADVVAQ